MIWGLSSALHEETLVDERYGQFLSAVDDKSNPLKSQGVGELGICGSGAAFANAIYNACGVRVRSYPITLDKLFLDSKFPT